MRYYAGKALRYQDKKKFFESLYHWNMALAHAPLALAPKNALLAHIYRQRSKIYFQLNLYKQCLRNIKLAKKSGNLTTELLRQKKFCERAIGKHGRHGKKNRFKKPVEQFLKLTYMAYPEIPFILDCLNVEESESGNGINISTAQDLKVGDIISIEDPMDAEIFSGFQRCYHCQENNFLDLFACSCCNGKSSEFLILNQLINCLHLVMFCSMKCKEDAFKMYHNYECVNNCIAPNLAYLKNVMRLFYFALFLFDGKIEELKAFILSNGTWWTTFHCDMRDLDPIVKGRYMLICYNSLVPSQRCTEVKPFHLMFENHPLLKTMWKKERRFIKEFLNRYYDIFEKFHCDLTEWPLNTAELMERTRNGDYDITKILKVKGHGCYVFAPLFNHSCVPNVEGHLDVNNKLHLIVCKNVAKGEQLFVSYR